MSNVLTALQPVLFSAGRDVPRELVGMLAACTTDYDDKGVAKGDSVLVPVIPAMTRAAVTPAQVFTVGADRTPTTQTLKLNQFDEVTWNLNPEQERSLMNSGVAQETFRQTVIQAFRTLINYIEVFTCTAAAKTASRAYGTAGTTPFGSDITAVANFRKILDDNGAGVMDRQVVMNTAAGVNLRNNGIFKVNEAGSSDPLRRGSLLDIHNFSFRESAGIQTPTKGTGASYTTDSAGYAVGATAITLITGTGSILAGDIVTFAGDTNKYVVGTALVGAAPGVVTLQEPGLRVAIAASPTAITVGATAAQNLAFQKRAIIAVVRPGLQPVGAVAEQMVISDPLTGFSALLLRVPGSAITSWYLRVVYDTFSPNPYAIATVLG